MGAVAVTAAALFSPEVRDRASGRMRPLESHPAAARSADGTTVSTPVRAQGHEHGRLDAAALELALEAAPPNTADLILGRELAAWLREDAPAAARFAELQMDPFLREVALRAVAQEWAKSSPESAAHWAESLVDGHERDRALEDVALTIARARPASAVVLLAHRDIRKSPDSALMGVVTTWAGADFVGARRWLEAQPASPDRDTIAQRLVQMRAQDDPRAAAILIDRMIDDEAARRDAWAAIAQSWSARDPALVHQWADSTDPATRRRIETELALAAGASTPD